MTTFRRGTGALLAVAAVVATLSACASSAPADGQPSEPVSVLGQGTVLQIGDAAPQFCLGAIAESYPPQCSGAELTGWDWALYEGSEASGDTTWGAYAVWGDWNGESLAVTDAITLALYDPIPVVDPALDPANAGASTDEELVAIQDSIADEAPVEVLLTYSENGYLFARVVFDDGEIQAWADERYGPDVVQIRPALSVVE